MPNKSIRLAKSALVERALPLRLLTILLVLGLAACSSTRLTDSWVDPTLQSAPHFKKLMAAVLSADQALRRSTEDALVAELKGAPAVPSYALMPAWEGGRLDSVRARLEQAGIDGVVALRLAGVDKEQTWVPGTYPGFGGYWRYGYSAAYNPGYLRTDTIVRVEISVYSVPEDKLIYAARSRTFDPGSSTDTVKEIVESVAADLKKRGLLH